MYINPALILDAYKLNHKPCYPDGITEVYSNFTNRGSRIPGIDKVVVFGIQYYLIEYLIERWNKDFFEQSRDKVLYSFKRRADHMLGPDSMSVAHIAMLHELGYLPLRIKALPEGSLCPLRVPMLTIRNTHPDFAWLTNAIETNLSCAIWHPQTSATKSFYLYKQLLADAMRSNSAMRDFVKYQAHDFSMRGMTSLESAMGSGAGHLLSFFGTDTVPAIDWLIEYYDADPDNEVIGCSVPATEHSVMQAGGKDNERETFRRLMCDIFPKGIVSIVSDTWDFWNVVTNILPSLKEEIMNREGTVTIRPDSGIPENIICGDPNAFEGSAEYKGAIECLWDIFGGTVSPEGKRQLDPHISLIYGDSMSAERMALINQRLCDKGFASTNYLGGVGSFFFQYVTRDTFSSAMKNTNVVIDGISSPTFKDPKTDDGTKRSARGYLRVNADYTLSEEVFPDEETQGLLEVVFEDSKLMKRQSLSEIRARLMAQV